MPSHSRTGGAKGSRHGRAPFDAYYGSVYGARWATLKSAMQKPTAKVAMWNRFCRLPMEGTMEGLVEMPAPALRLFTTPAESDGRLLEQPPRDEAGTPAYYLFDYASAMIVEQLQVDGFNKVLDLCAAPGGKSIGIAQFLTPQGEIQSNESRGDRAQRLRRNMQEHLPANSCIWSVSQRDATTWHHPEGFDRVLVDAPCSSERHIMHQPGGASEWGLHLTQDLAKVQGALLLRAMESVKVGGLVVYSTCSISPVENDDVVAYALARTRCHMELQKIEMPIGEATERGWIILPDRGDAGWGPMYCTRLVKVASQRPLSDSSSDDESSDGEA